MTVTTAFKRSWLRRKYRAITTTLLAILNSANDTALDAVASSGGNIIATSANGHSVQFAAGGDGMISQQDIAELTGEMLDRYDSANAALIASGIPAPTDLQIYNQMLAELAAAFVSTPDFSNMRLVNV